MNTSIVARIPLSALPPPDDPAWRLWLTPDEIAFSAGLRRHLEHLAARLLAKRAVAELLGWGDDVPWDQIEIRRREHTAPEVWLGEDALGWCRMYELPVPGVSLTHAGGQAAALAWPGRPAYAPVHRLLIPGAREGR